MRMNLCQRSAARAVLAAITLIGAVVPPGTAAPLDTTADAALGQPDLASLAPNQPAAIPTTGNLALSNAADIALAPDGRIYVSDADNHRILSWPDAATFNDGLTADLVIGQPDFNSAAPNRGRFTTAGRDGLFLPQGVDVDPSGNLWVADAFNNRVLRFDDPTRFDGQADLVIGQRDFDSNGANLGLGDDGAGNALPDSLLFPGRVLARPDGVWISDSGNSRVLHYAPPTGNKPFADFVLGQFGDFTKRAKNNNGAGNSFGPPSADNLFNCIGIALDAFGNLYVADWQNHRVLRYDDPLHTDATADAVFGQDDFAGAIVDRGGPANGLHLPIDVALGPAGALFIADSNNHRVLEFTDPLFDQSVPDRVFGQLGNLNADTPNHGLGPLTTDADGLHGPTGIALDTARNLFVVDTNNNRALRFDMIRPPTAPADFDLDGDVDGDDLHRLVSCVNGLAEQAASPSCGPTDLAAPNGTGMDDYAVLQRCFGGAGVATDADCAD
jgi:sugar lactone lactonase YvrE